MKFRVLFLSLGMLFASAQAQTQYAVDQTLPLSISSVEINKGWDVHIVKDTANIISIISPCEYFFEEGNEPQVCRVEAEESASNRLIIEENTSMPKNTIVELHLRAPLHNLLLRPSATLSADTLFFVDSDKSFLGVCIELQYAAKLNASYVNADHIDVGASAVMTVRRLECSDTLKIKLRSESSLVVDTLQSAETDIRRHPLASCNILFSDDSTSLRLHNRTSWFSTGFQSLNLTTGFTHISTSNRMHADNPLSFSSGLALEIGINTNVNYFSKWGGISIGLKYSLNVAELHNNVRAEGGQVVLDTANLGRNRVHGIVYHSIALPVRLHFATKYIMKDLHVGLEPTLNFGQSLSSTMLGTDGKFHSSDERVSAINTFQLRAEVGFQLQDYGFYMFSIGVDLLPTYRFGAECKPVHGIYLKLNF